MKQGAEARVEKKDGKVIKKREEKTYRHEELDERIRNERTSEELKNIKRARKYGVKIPETEEKNPTTLKQTEVNGKALKEVIETKIEELVKVGENIAKLHSSKIIHGDITTSNILVDGEEVYLIDLGLSEISERVEDKAVDIHLLKQVLRTSHPEVAEDAWEKFIEGYREHEDFDKVMGQLEDVESRGRYK